jgi:sterol desaturase/sphingolipid hydroxylase (fatty acid hydroxylase superfamily)
MSQPRAFAAAKHSAALHHYARHPCNFGVTTQIWDRVFGTVHRAR